eukprot:scaffold141986_cov29-Tisochrysis_lutea.AAC.8
MPIEHKPFLHRGIGSALVNELAKHARQDALAPFARRGLNVAVELTQSESLGVVGTIDHGLFAGVPCGCKRPPGGGFVCARGANHQHAVASSEQVMQVHGTRCRRDGRLELGILAARHCVEGVGKEVRVAQSAHQNARLRLRGLRPPCTAGQYESILDRAKAPIIVWLLGG